MKFTNKMVLVPEQAMNQMRQSEELGKNGIEKQVLEFRKALYNVLNDDKLRPEEQMSIYSQLFSRYLHLDNDSKQPATVMFKPEITNSQQDSHVETEQKEDTIFKVKDEPIVETDDWVKNVFHHLPKIHKKKAELMVDFLKNSTNITVGEKGEVIIDNQKISNSHIVDLVHDVLRDRPKADPPNGLTSFVTALKKSNVPISYIGNPARLKMIKEISTGSSEFESPTQSVRKRLVLTNDAKDSKRKKKVAYDSW